MIVDRVLKVVDPLLEHPGPSVVRLQRRVFGALLAVAFLGRRIGKALSR